VIREPAQLTIGEDGTIALPLGLLAESGLPPGSPILAYCSGDGRIVLRRENDAVEDLIALGELR